MVWARWGRGELSPAERVAVASVYDGEQINSKVKQKRETEKRQSRGMVEEAVATDFADRACCGCLCQ